MTVHNHGPAEGKGLACRERRVDGRLVGECIAPFRPSARAEALIREAIDYAYNEDSPVFRKALRALREYIAALEPLPSGEETGTRVVKWTVEQMRAALSALHLEAPPKVVADLRDRFEQVVQEYERALRTASARVEAGENWRGEGDVEREREFDENEAAAWGWDGYHTEDGVSFARMFKRQRDAILSRLSSPSISAASRTEEG